MRDAAYPGSTSPDKNFGCRYGYRMNIITTHTHTLNEDLWYTTSPMRDAESPAEYAAYPARVLAQTIRKFSFTGRYVIWVTAWAWVRGYYIHPIRTPIPSPFFHHFALYFILCCFPIILTFFPIMWMDVDIMENNVINQVFPFMKNIYEDLFFYFNFLCWAKLIITLSLWG